MSYPIFSACSFTPTGTGIVTCGDPELALCAVFEDEPADMPASMHFGSCMLADHCLGAAKFGGLRCLDDAGVDHGGT